MVGSNMSGNVAFALVSDLQRKPYCQGKADGRKHGHGMRLVGMVETKGKWDRGADRWGIAMGVLMHSITTKVLYLGPKYKRTLVA